MSAVTEERPDAVLMQAFRMCTIPAAEWAHREHLRIATLFLVETRDLDTAHILMRVGIIRQNAAQGLVETAIRGYHETITRAWLLVVQNALAEDRELFSSTQALLASTRAHRARLPLRYYSRDRLMSRRLAATFVTSDRQPLPK